MFNMCNKKGSALMQVLFVTVVVATIATFILRLSISRTSTAARSARVLAAKNVIEGCNSLFQAEMMRLELEAAKNGTAFVPPSTSPAFTCVPKKPDGNVDPNGITVRVYQTGLDSDGRTMGYRFEIDANDSLKL